MQFTTGIFALFLASTAMACANGPYKTGSICPSDCGGVQRCGDNNNVIRCDAGRWVAIKACGHCKFGSCV